MSAENKPGFMTGVAEFSQKWDIVSSIGAVGLTAVGIIPIGFTIAFLGFNAVTYFGVEKLKVKN